MELQTRGARKYPTPALLQTSYCAIRMAIIDESRRGRRATREHIVLSTRKSANCNSFRDALRRFTEIYSASLGFLRVQTPRYVPVSWSFLPDVDNLGLTRP
jgi:hypothetical protein